MRRWDRGENKFLPTNDDDGDGDGDLLHFFAYKNTNFVSSRSHMAFNFITMLLLLATTADVRIDIDEYF